MFTIQYRSKKNGRVLLHFAKFNSAMSHFNYARHSKDNSLLNLLANIEWPDGVRDRICVVASYRNPGCGIPAKQCDSPLFFNGELVKCKKLTG